MRAGAEHTLAVSCTGTPTASSLLLSPPMPSCPKALEPHASAHAGPGRVARGVNARTTGPCADYIGSGRNEGGMTVCCVAEEKDRVVPTAGYAAHVPSEKHAGRGVISTGRLAAQAKLAS
jgi:hypothetical protein